MKIEIIEDKKALFVADFDGASHELCIALQEELYKDEAVSVATYRMEHPLMRKARVFVETKGKEAKGVVKDAIARLEKQNKSILSQIDKAL